MPAEDRSKMSVMLTCADTAKSAAFYRDKLGFAMKESWPSEDDPQWCNMLLGGQSVMLGAAMEPNQVGQYCAGDAAAEAYWRKASSEFKENKPGVGIQVYLMVDDIDAYAAEVKGKGVELISEPKTQFYGIREIHLEDPSAYHLVFFTPVAMESCQSCGMPLADAAPGQMYCAYCTDDEGALKPYEQVFEGTVTGYFMGMQKMSRADAEKAASEHLKKLPAWVSV